MEFNNCEKSILLFTIGLLIIYIIIPTPHVVTNYPSLDELEDKIYEDDEGNKYKFQISKN
jgi:hypothetical protein